MRVVRSFAGPRSGWAHTPPLGTSTKRRQLCRLPGTADTRAARLGLALVIVSMTGCGAGSHTDSTKTVTVELTVTSSGAPIHWSGTLDGGRERVDVQGITP